MSRDRALRDLRRLAPDDPQAANRLAQETLRTHGFRFCASCRALVPAPDAEEHAAACADGHRSAAEQAAIDGMDLDLSQVRLRQQPFYDRAWLGGRYGSRVDFFSSPSQFINPPPGNQPGRKFWGVDTNVTGNDTYNSAMRLLATRLELIPDPGCSQGALDWIKRHSYLLLRGTTLDLQALPGSLALRGAPLTSGGKALLLGDDAWRVRLDSYTDTKPPLHSYLCVIHGVWVTTRH